MLYTDFKAGEKEYKLRMTTRAVVALEKQLGCNPISIFSNEEELPTVTAMVQILHAALQQYEHGITLNDAFDIFYYAAAYLKNYSLRNISQHFPDLGCSKSQGNRLCAAHCRY